MIIWSIDNAILIRVAYRCNRKFPPPENLLPRGGGDFLGNFPPTLKIYPPNHRTVLRVKTANLPPNRGRGIGIFLEKNNWRVQIPRKIAPRGYKFLGKLPPVGYKFLGKPTPGGADLPGGGVFFLGNMPPGGQIFLGNIPPWGENFLGNLGNFPLRGGHFPGGKISWVIRYR